MLELDLSQPLVPIAELEDVAQGADHSEGICVTPDGVIYFGGEAGQLYRLETDDSLSEVLTTNGFLLGLASDAESRIYACDPRHNCVWRIAVETRDVEIFCADAEGRPKLLNPNWGCFDAEGNYYFSDSGIWKGADGVVIVVRRGGQAAVWTEESRNFPNGLALSSDQRHLLVLESTPGALVRYQILADGSAGQRELLVDLEGTVPDGVAVADDDSLIIACYRPDVILRWREDLGIQVLAADPEGTAIAAPTNVVFSGPELDTLVVPNIGRWHLTRFRYASVRGIPLHYPTREQIGS